MSNQPVYSVAYSISKSKSIFDNLNCSNILQGKVFETNREGPGPGSYNSNGNYKKSSVKYY